MGIITILNITFLLHVTNRHTTKIVKTTPVETPVIITTKEFVVGVMSNVDLLPVTAFESVTPTKEIIKSVIIYLYFYLHI